MKINLLDAKRPLFVEEHPVLTILILLLVVAPLIGIALARIPSRPAPSNIVTLSRGAQCEGSQGWYSAPAIAPGTVVKIVHSSLFSSQVAVRPDFGELVCWVPNEALR